MTVEQALQAMAVFPESPWVHRSVANVLVAEVERLRADNQALLDAAEVQGEIVLKMAAEAAKGAADGRD